MQHSHQMIVNWKVVGLVWLCSLLKLAASPCRDGRCRSLIDLHLACFSPCVSTSSDESCPNSVNAGVSGQLMCCPNRIIQDSCSAMQSRKPKRNKRRTMEGEPEATLHRLPILHR